MDNHEPPLGIKEFADVLGISYEHSRKMVRGLAVPTRFLILAIAKEFGEDPGELERLAKEDSFRRKYGAESPTPIFNPEVAPFATAWHMLTDSQKNDLLARLKTHVAANTKKAKHA